MHKHFPNRSHPYFRGRKKFSSRGLVGPFKFFGFSTAPPKHILAVLSGCPFSQPSLMTSTVLRHAALFLKSIASYFHEIVRWISGLILRAIVMGIFIAMYIRTTYIATHYTYTYKRVLANNVGVHVFDREYKIAWPSLYLLSHSLAIAPSWNLFYIETTKL